MIRHVVLVTLRADVDTAAVDEIVDALRALPAQIPAIRSYEVSADIGLSNGHSTFGALALFDDLAGYIEYRDHPAHLAVIDTLIAPVRISRAAVQIEVPTPAE